jgi:hypothetical protein
MDFSDSMVGQFDDQRHKFVSLISDHIDIDQVDPMCDQNGEALEIPDDDYGICICVCVYIYITLNL